MKRHIIIISTIAALLAAGCGTTSYPAAPYIHNPSLRSPATVTVGNLDVMVDKPYRVDTTTSRLNADPNSKLYDLANDQVSSSMNPIESPTFELEYSLDHSETININASAREELIIIHQLLSDARRGSTVTLSPQDDNLRQAPREDTIVLETTSMEQVVVWCQQMIHLGYTVTIDYNRDTGIYYCTAVRTIARRRK